MKNSPLSRPNLLMMLASFVIVIAGLKSAGEIVSPFLLALFIAAMSAPAIFWLESKGLARIIAFLIVTLLVSALFSLIVLLIASSLNSFLSQLPELQSRLLTLLGNMVTFLNALDFGFNFDLSQMPETFQPAYVINALGGVLRSLSKLLSSSFLIFLMVAFILFETTSLGIKMDLILGERSKERESIVSFIEKLKRYIAIKSLASMATGLFIGILLSLIGVKYALLWGFIAFVLNYIPAIGSIVAAIPAILVSFVEHDVQTVFMVIAVFASINIAIGNVIEPRFLGKGLGLSPLVILLSLIFWGWVLGYIGMFLAVPITVSIVMALELSPQTRWIAIILSDRTSHIHTD